MGTRTFCRICIGVCGLDVDVEEGRIVALRGDAEHPISAGYTCNKGRALPAVHDSPDRLFGPLMRGETGGLADVTWDDALADIAARLQDTVTTYGADSVGVFTGNGVYLDAAGYWASRRLLRRLGTRHAYSNMSIDSAAKYRVGELMAGTHALVAHADPEAPLVLLIGTNPVVSHGQTPMFQNPVERLRASTSGGEVWVVDPRTTESSRLAGHHLPIRPGTDYALLGYLVRSLLLDADRGALEQRATNVEELASAVAPFTLERAAGLTGLLRSELTDLLAAIRRAGRIAVLSGTGVTMSPGANAAEWLIVALLLVTDSLDRPGGMWFNPGYLARLDRRDALPAVPAREGGPPTRPDIDRLMGEWPSAVIPGEIEAGNLRALIVLGANLVTCLPDTNRTVAALRDLDLVVVLEMSHTETTELATHVLPTHAQLERPDVSVLNDLFNPVVSSQYTPALLPQHPGRRSMWWTVAELGRALGVDVLPDGVDLDTTDDEILRLAFGVGELQQAERPWAVASPPAHGWVQDRLPHGRWDLAPAPLVAQLADMAAPPPLVLTPRRQGKRMNGRTIREGDAAEVWLHPADAERAGVHDGDMVDVTSTAGAVHLTARVTEGTREGAASIAHGWSGANVNLLVDSDELDPLTGMPGLSGTPISLRLVASAAPSKA